MIAFIDDHREGYGVEPICAALEIAPSTYWSAKTRPPCARAVRDAHDLLLAAGVPVLGMIGNARSVRPQRLIEGSATLPEVVSDAGDPEHRLLGPGPRTPAAT